MSAVKQLEIFHTIRNTKCLCPGKNNVSCSNKTKENATDAGEANENTCANQNQKQQQCRDEDEIRAMVLYGRLFLRKGPWFRLDDLLSKYYMQYMYCTFGEKENDDDSSQERNENAVESEFSKRKETYAIGLRLLLKDLQRLLDTGLVRPFHDDNECARVAGRSTVRDCGVLTSKEREHVLKRMGGGVRMRSNSNRRTSSRWKDDDKDNSKYPVSAQLNLVQYRKADANNSSCRNNNNKFVSLMKSQRSIFPIRAGGTIGGASHSLPVCKFVDEIILNAVMSKLDDSYPTGLKVDNDSLSKVNDIVASMLKEYLSVHGGALCLRLREAPLEALRRSCRLFLCAGNGPGHMRGGAWVSVYSYPERLPTDFSVAQLSPLTNPWLNVNFPGLQRRLMLKSFELERSFELLTASKSECCDYRKCVAMNGMNIFHNVHDFNKWESAVEVRSQIDFLLEAVDVCHTMKKRDFDDVDTISVTDCFDILQLDGRLNLISKFFAQDLVRGGGAISDAIELQLRTLCSNKSSSTKYDILTIKDNFLNDGERMICALCICLGEILKQRFRAIELSEATTFKAKPWLRHMRFEAVLALCIYDGVAMLEKRGYYELSVKLLSLILAEEYFIRECGFESYVEAFVVLLIPRRTRGKAYDRLAIDQGHIFRQRRKEVNSALGTSSSTAAMQLELNEIDRFYSQTLQHVGNSSTVPFSFVRNLARRLRRPLKDSIAGILNHECMELNIRLESLGGGNMQLESSKNDCDNDASKIKRSSTSRPTKKVRYHDWEPTTDTSVANATNDNVPGTRRSFIGLVENHDGIPSRSLNVEELAIEEYATGRLPNTGDIDGLEGGGWIGWHDEGGMVRTLFRILCWERILSLTCCRCEEEYDPSLFLSPYQTSSHDLHVAYMQIKCNDNRLLSTSKCFYERRRQEIEIFLSALKKSSPEDVAHLVFRSVMDKVNDCTRNQRIVAESLQKDLQQIRTLTMIAVAIGGEMLASIFRCLFYDYRHYSGGLPDLLLVRAQYDDGSLLGGADLGEWVGECFSPDVVEEGKINEVINRLIDRDDEFLGCSKNSDFQQNSRGKRKRGGKLSNYELNTDMIGENVEESPRELELNFNGRNVCAQSIFGKFFVVTLLFCHHPDFRFLLELLLPFLTGHTLLFP